MGYFLDNAQMTMSGTPGTGPLTLGSATPGAQTFAAAGAATGQLIPYNIEDAAGAWEYGRGVYSSIGPTLTRSIILGSSSGGSAISATSAAIVTATALAEDLSAWGVGFRNRAINGAMAIDQRNNGASQTIVAAAALAYCIDRFYAYCTGANVTGQRVAGSAPDQYLYQFTGAASVTAIGFAQRMEAANTFDLAGQNATLSVELANSLLTTVTWTAYYANTTDTFGTLASPTKTQIATGTFTINSTLTRYQAQIAISSAATTGIEIVLTVGAQTSGTWQIGEFQLEPGQVQSPFERRPIGVELSLCQRYLPAVNTLGTGALSYAGQAYSGTDALIAIAFAVPARVPVTGILVNTVGDFALTETTSNRATATGITFSAAPSINGAVLDVTVAAASLTAGNGTLLWSLASGGQILFTGAEL